MERRTLSPKGLVLTAVLIALAALCLMPMHATAAGSKAKKAVVYNKEVGQISISMSSKGIIAMPASLQAGNHLLTIKNNTSEPRGVEMIGIDKASSPTVRYTKILKPGKSESFRWFFAKGKTVYVRDILACAHDQRSCMMVTFGQMTKAIDVN